MDTIGVMAEAASTIKRAVIWLGGPWDGSKTLVTPGAMEFAVAYDQLGERIISPKVQNYVADPAYWLKERDRRVAKVHVFPITWRNSSCGDIHWHERNYRVIEAGSSR